MKFRTVIYTLLLATLCMGCGGSLSMRQLEQLEARINDAPDSVLRVLTATDMPRWGEARALYALLTVQAQDKSFIDVADDSLICVATDYYATSSDARHRMLAFYYLSRVQYNMQAYAQSIISASRAEEEAITVSDDYYLGLIYRYMTDGTMETPRWNLIDNQDNILAMRPIRLLPNIILSAIQTCLKMAETLAVSPAKSLCEMLRFTQHDTRRWVNCYIVSPPPKKKIVDFRFTFGIFLRPIYRDYSMDL